MVALLAIEPGLVVAGHKENGAATREQNVERRLEGFEFVRNVTSDNHQVAVAEGGGHHSVAQPLQIVHVIRVQIRQAKDAINLGEVVVALKARGGCG